MDGCVRIMNVAEQSEQQRAAEIIEAIKVEALWAAEQMSRYHKLYSGWRAEYERLGALWREWEERRRARPQHFEPPVSQPPLTIISFEAEGQC